MKTTSLFNSFDQLVSWVKIHFYKFLHKQFLPSATVLDKNMQEALVQRPLYLKTKLNHSMSFYLLTFIVHPYHLKLKCSSQYQNCKFYFAIIFRKKLLFSFLIYFFIRICHNNNLSTKILILTK